MYCNHCGKMINEKNQTCLFCGTVANQPEVKKPINVLGIVGLIISLPALYFGSLYCIAPAIGLILNAIALSRSEKRSYNNFAFIGLVISIIGLLFWSFILIILFLWVYDP